jgi:hypothetical protein
VSESSQDSAQTDPASAFDLTRVWLCEDCVRPMCQASASRRRSTKAWDVLLRPLRGSAAVGVRYASPTCSTIGHSARALRQLCSCAHECPARLSYSRVGHSSSQIASTRRRDLTRQPIHRSSARSPGSIRQAAPVRCPSRLHRRPYPARRHREVLRTGASTPWFAACAMATSVVAALPGAALRNPLQIQPIH